MLTPVLLALVAGYVLGALPFGWLVARAKGVDIFKVGSGNPGATNVRRTLGPGPGNLVFALDVLKGVAAAGWPRLWTAGADPVALGVAGLVGALLGHSFSCFTRLRGGKGVATGAGGFLVLMPWVALIGGAVWVITFYSSRYVSLASMLAAVALPVAAFALDRPPLLVAVGAAAAVFVVVRHRSNVKRLLDGTEHRFEKRRSPAP